MLVKRYHAKDMQKAMDQIIRELGSDAVILSSRKIREKGLKNLFHRKILEVMVAYDPTLIPGAKPAPLPPPVKKEPAITEEALRAAEISKKQFERLDKRIDELSEVLNDFAQKFMFIKRDVTFDYSKEVEELVAVLVEGQVREELAHMLARETEAIKHKQPETPAAEIMEQVVTERLGVPSPILPKKFKQKIVLMLGPTGVGKTTSIVKLAADFVINQKKKVGIINTDTYRIAAQEQLKTYTEILDVPLSVVYQMNELADKLSGMNDREIIFIDTAGKRPGDEQHTEDVKNIIEIADPEDILLCVPASVNFAALKEIVDSYSYAGAYKLLVTKIDETKHRGMILNLCWYAKRELSYFTTGQNVPDDIEKIDIETLAREILGRRT